MLDKTDTEGYSDRRQERSGLDPRREKVKPEYKTGIGTSLRKIEIEKSDSLQEQRLVRKERVF